MRSQHSLAIKWTTEDAEGRRFGTVEIDGCVLAVKRGANGVLYIEDFTGRWQVVGGTQRPIIALPAAR